MGECHNVGGNEEHANLDIVRRLCAGVDVAFQELPELAASTIRWMLDNEAWWRAVMDGSYREWLDAQYVAR